MVKVWGGDVVLMGRRKVNSRMLCCVAVCVTLLLWGVTHF